MTENLEVIEEELVESLRQMAPDDLERFQEIVDHEALFYRNRRDYFDKVSRIVEQVVRENAALDIMRHISERD